MKIKYLTEDGLLLLKNNKNSVYKSIIKDGETLNDYLGNNGFLKESHIEMEDIVLDNSQVSGKEALTDSENVQRVYSHMKGLSDSQASDERIWVALSLGEQIDYMRYRWKCNNSDEMLNRYFFNYSIQRSLFRNGLSRLWWIGRVTYDEKKEDPYALTKFLCKDQDFIETICGRNVFNNFTILKATISALYDAEQDGISISRELVRSVGKNVNLLAGTYIIDVMEYDVLYNKIKRIIEKQRGVV